MSKLSLKSMSLIVILFLSANIIAQKSNKTKEVVSPFNKAKVVAMVHFGAGAGDYAVTSIGLSVFQSLHQNIMLGASVQYMGENGRGNTRLLKWQKIPLTLETNIDIKKYNNNRSSIFLRAGLGYCFTLNGSYVDPNDLAQKNVSNGLTFSPGLGFRLNILKNSGLRGDISYSLISDRLQNETGEKLSINYWNHLIFRASIFF